MFYVLPSAHLVSEVDDDEGGVGHTRFLEVSAAGVLLVELLGPVLICSLWHLEHEGDYVRTRGEH